MNAEESNVGTFLENLMKDKIDREIIRMIMKDTDQEKMLEALMEMVPRSRDKDD
jgi:hypothetical protein